MRDKEEVMKKRPMHSLRKVLKLYSSWNHPLKENRLLSDTNISIKIVANANPFTTKEVLIAIRKLNRRKALGYDLINKCAETTRKRNQIYHPILLCSTRDFIPSQCKVANHYNPDQSVELAESYKAIRSPIEKLFEKLLHLGLAAIINRQKIFLNH